MSTRVKAVKVDKKWLDMLNDMDTLASLRESHSRFNTIWNNVKTALKLDPSGFGKWLLDTLPKSHALYKRVEKTVNPKERDSSKAIAKVFSMNKAKFIELLRAEGYSVSAPKRKA